MTVLVTFDKTGNKVNEFIQKNAEGLIETMMNFPAALLIEKNGNRVTKGTLPKRFKTAYEWVR